MSSDGLGRLGTDDPSNFDAANDAATNGDVTKGEVIPDSPRSSSDVSIPESPLSGGDVTLHMVQRPPPPKAEVEGAGPRGTGHAPSTAPARLRTRITSASYKYSLLEDDDHVVGSYPMVETGGPCLDQRWLWAAMALLVLLLTAFAVALILMLHMRDVDEYTCNSPECVAAAAGILAAMNRSAQPCQDMYQYACGSWVASSSIPAGYSKWSRFAELEQSNQQAIRALVESDGNLFKGVNSSAIAKLKTYYRTCMDEDKIEEQGIEPLVKLLDTIGGWPVVHTWNKDSWTLQSALTAAHRTLGSGLFSIGSVPDDRNTSRHRLQFSQSGLTLAYEDEYLGDEAEKFKLTYLDYAASAARLLGAATPTHALAQVHALETRLAKIFVPRENMTDPVSLYNLMSIKDFQALIGDWFDIQQYLTAVFAPLPPPTDDVIVVTPDYFKKLADVIKDTDNETLANYIGWRTVQSSISYMPKGFADAKLKLSRAQSGVSSLAPRWQRCLAVADQALGLAASALYVDKFFTAKDRNEVVLLVRELQAAFIANLPAVTWLDDQTRARLRDKASKVNLMVAYPDWITSVEELDKYYNKLEVKEGQMLQNKLNSIVFELHRAARQYSKEPNRQDWEDMLPHIVNAAYEPLFNTIMVPAGILQPPFYVKDAPRAFVHGSLGAVLGHELSHGFDNAGRRYDARGNMADMWSPHADAAFQKQSKCIINQYGNFAIQGHNLNGLLTLGENIADNAGVKLSYASLQARGSDSKALPGVDLTDDQLFFLGFSQVWCAHITPEHEIASLTTDPHSHPIYRILGTFQNSDRFLPSFNCDRTSKYYTSKKCSLW